MNRSSTPSVSKILVTGVAGFIGARVAEVLLAEGNHVVGLDNLSDYYDINLKSRRLKRLTQAENSPDVANNFRFLKTDIEDIQALVKVLAEHQFDAVINLAARAGVRESVKHPHAFMKTNAMGVLNLLEQMREHNVKKLVLASTSSLYAGQPIPFKETAALEKPISPYAASKKSAESMAHAFHSLHGIDVSILRYFTVYGPSGRPDMSPSRFINWVQTGQPIQLFGDGHQQRDFTYIDDIARGTIAALKPLGYEIINLGFGKPYSMLELIEKSNHWLGVR